MEAARLLPGCHPARQVAQVVGILADGLEDRDHRHQEEATRAAGLVRARQGLRPRLRRRAAQAAWQWTCQSKIVTA